MRIDLHTHTKFSDGTDAPSELMLKAAHAKLDVVGVADHDTIDGWNEAANFVKTSGVSLVRGMEISSLYDGHDVHVLGILFNPDDATVQLHINTMKNARQLRAQKIVELLSADFLISWDDVLQAAATSKSIGRPHIADALVSKGIVKNRDEAFARLLHTSSPYYVPQIAPSTIQAIDMIKSAGGRAILAHPKAVKRGYSLSDDAIREFAQAGLFGIEIDHRDNPPSQRPVLKKLAKELGLARFGASDYHGTGKPNTLGEGLTAQEVFETAIEGTYLEVLHP
ncbi:putative metal-dependent phosphoesterase TrpH [Arcanobacterium pluranimalium]|uniref:PHP domain-containing protein n=1 Tax=Arcanobacterium pluranimalium TaxID=108028 RepID=UPI00195C39E9|nr:PHP domain-containing protein [Arcanobacterium pluranimalium]MBM7825084.1 putative metal-dependent phosphoesterase TrpH [Arcanobacterium pluranimalium]